MKRLRNLNEIFTATSDERATLLSAAFFFFFFFLKVGKTCLKMSELGAGVSDEPLSVWQSTHEGGWCLNLDVIILSNTGGYATKLGLSATFLQKKAFFTHTSSTVNDRWKSCHLKNCESTLLHVWNTNIFRILPIVTVSYNLRLLLHSWRRWGHEQRPTTSVGSLNVITEYFWNEKPWTNVLAVMHLPCHAQEWHFRCGISNCSGR